MAGYRHIVVATDLTEAAAAAANRVTDQAHCSGGRITLLHLVEHAPEPVAGIGEERSDPEEHLMANAGRHLFEWAERYHLTGAERQVLLVRDSAPRAVIDYLAEQQADLVVFGPLRITGKAGSIADRVAAEAPCDVLIVQDRG